MQGALYEADIDMAPLAKRQLAIIGYGNHGRSHALNLHDYGVKDILIALRDGSPSRAKAENDGFEVVSLADAAARADLISLLAADEAHGAIWSDHIAPNRKPGQGLILCHGFSIEYGLITPPADCDVILAAAKGPGGAVRESYLKGGGLVGFRAVHQDASSEADAIALAYLKGLGCGRAGIGETSFREEALADILGEQAVLVGGMCALAREGYEALIRAGISPLLPEGSWTGFVLQPDRAELYRRIEARFDAMMAAGALEEARALHARGLDRNLPAMKAVGLRPLLAHLDGEMTLEEAVVQGKTDSRRYAKRQFTWFANQHGGWPRLPADDPDAALQIMLQTTEKEG